MNPCRCGGGSPGATCKRGPKCATDYQARISGPLLDRIDLQIEVPAVSAADLVLPAPTEGSAEVRARVIAARARAESRLAAIGVTARGMRNNAGTSGAVLEQVANLDGPSVELLRTASATLQLSARGYHRTIKVARTLADLDGQDGVNRMHIAEALSYRGETFRQRNTA
jgi:magnesium chelatase family protein